MTQKLAIWERDRLAAGWMGSTVGALAAIVLWLILSWVFGERLPGLPLAIGMLAAVGMALVYREQDFNAGFGALNVALLTIFAVASTTFAFFTPVEPSQRLEHLRNMLALAQVESALDAQGHRTVEARRRNGGAVERDARAALLDTSDEEVERQWNAWRSKQPSDAKAIWLTSYAFGAPRDVELILDLPPEPQPGVVARFFSVMFPPLALFELFGALAIAFYVPLVGLKRILRMVVRI